MPPSVPLLSVCFKPSFPLFAGAERTPLVWTAAGFINYAGEDVDLYSVGPHCEHHLTASAPLGARGGQRHFASWSGQRFRVRGHRSQQLLVEHTVGCGSGETLSSMHILLDVALAAGTR